MTRNCFRCGHEFESNGGARICGECSAASVQKKPLNPHLSFREKQVVNLVCAGKLNKEIAAQLHLTEGTIKEYMHRIFLKVVVSNRAELAVWAVTRASVSPEIQEAA